jgi:hypothetical protein
MTHGRAFLVGVPLVAVAIAVAFFATRDTARGDFQARATAVCNSAQSELEQLPQSPGSIAEALELEHSALAIYRREVAELRALGPQASASFRAGLAADQALLANLSSMLARPDFVRLSLTLPGHPDLAPSWLKAWLTRSRVLQAEASTRFAKAGVPACANSFGSGA